MNEQIWRANEKIFNGKRSLSVMEIGEFEKIDDENRDYRFSIQEKQLIKMPDSYTYDEERSFIRCGSVRGVRNGVKRTIGQLLLQGQWTKNYEEEDKGKVIIYMTSLGIVRRTWERCRQAVALLDNHMIEFERRDLGFSRHLRSEFQNRLHGSNDSKCTDLPAIFVDGQYFGDLETLEKWSECGLLKRFLEPYKRTKNHRSLCQKCYGFCYYPCPTCRGSKKSPKIIDSSQIHNPRLKCTKCDFGGLVPCYDCKDGYTI